MLGEEGKIKAAAVVRYQEAITDKVKKARQDLGKLWCLLNEPIHALAFWNMQDATQGSCQSVIPRVHRFEEGPNDSPLFDADRTNLNDGVRGRVCSGRFEVNGDIRASPERRQLGERDLV
jgi:hypothetical protein